MIACVAPSPSIDRLFEVECLRLGMIHRPTRFVQVAGGKGLNVARAAQALGADIRAVALLGGHSGRWIADELDELGLPLVPAWCRGETRSCLSVADEEPGTLTEFYEASAAVSREEWDAFARTVDGVAATAVWTTVSGSLPPGSPPDGYDRLAAAGTNVAVDTTALGAACPTLLKVNADEAATLTGVPLRSERDAIAAACELRRRIGGAGHSAAVTCGSDGAVVVGPDGTAWHGVLDVRGRYPVGSGDAFLAGLVTALAGGIDWPRALATALGAAAANAELPGAGLLDDAHARALAAQAVIEMVADVE